MLSLSDCTGGTDGRLVVDDDAARVSFASDVGDGIGHSIVSLVGPATSVAADDEQHTYIKYSSIVYCYLGAPRIFFNIYTSTCVQIQTINFCVQTQIYIFTNKIAMDSCLRKR